MKQIGILGCAVLAAIMLAGTGAAGDQIDTSDILVMGYYTNGTEIDLSQAIQEFDYVTESTGQYVEGELTMWYDSYYGTNPGNIRVYERKDGADTDILFATNVTVRVTSDGWIVAWLTNDQNISDIVFWSYANSATNPSDTTIGKAIWRITNRVGIDYNKDEVDYYSYKYPAADRLLVGGRMVRVFKMRHITSSYLLQQHCTWQISHGRRIYTIIILEVSRWMMNMCSAKVTAIMVCTNMLDTTKILQIWQGTHATPYTCQVAVVMLC